MNLEDIKIKYPGFYYYQCNTYASIEINFKFNYESTKENYVKSMILCKYLSETNAKYKTLKKLNDKCRDLYSANYFIDFTNTANKHFIEFTFNMYDYKIIGENYFKDAINFFHTIMFKPNFKDNHLDTFIFEKIKQEIFDDEKEANCEPRIMQYRYFLKYAFPQSDKVLNKYEDINELTEILSKITEKDIIDFYNEIMNNFVRGYVFGNLNDNEIDYIAQKFKFETSNFDSNYLIHEKISSGEKTIKSKDTTQSYLYVVYDISNYSIKERYIYQAIVGILNSSLSGLIYNVLRDELSLVYSANSTFYGLRGFMYIEANIDKKNKDKCLEGIEEIFKRLQDKEIIGKLLKFYQDKMNQNYYTKQEELKYYLNELNNFVYEISDSEEKNLSLINGLTTEDIIKYVKRLEKKFIFFYQGDK